MGIFEFEGGYPILTFSSFFTRLLHYLAHILL